MGKKNESVALCKIMNYMKNVLQNLFMLFQSVKKKVVLTEIKQHIQNPHKEIFFACHL